MILKQQYDQILVAPKPFVKWAGGKRQLISFLNENLPETFGTYYEPFLGGGALLFHILTKKNGQKCSISDLNSDLVLQVSGRIVASISLITRLHIVKIGNKRSQPVQYFLIKFEEKFRESSMCD